MQSGQRQRGLWTESLIRSLNEEHAAGHRELQERRRRPVTEAGAFWTRNIWSADSHRHDGRADRPSAALVKGATVLTANASDFEKVPGLTIDDWTR